MTAATLASMGIFLAGLVLWMAYMRMAAYADRLLDPASLERTRKVIVGMMLTPFVILGAGILFVWLKHTAPAIPMAHLLFLLGAWMIAILGGGIFALTAARKIEYSLPALLAVLIAIPLAIYFIPLSNFIERYLPGQTGLGVAAGVFGILVVELILYSIRKLAIPPITPVEST